MPLSILLVQQNISIQIPPLNPECLDFSLLILVDYYVFIEAAWVLIKENVRTSIETIKKLAAIERIFWSLLWYLSFLSAQRLGGNSARQFLQFLTIPI